MAELANCQQCDVVFVKNIRNICQACYEEEEKSFEVVYRFLMKRKNREATIDDIIEATEVKEDLIIKFMREKRLRLSQFPKLAYPCERCGNDIQTGNLCQGCQQSLQTDLEKHEKMVERKKEQKQSTAQVYYAYDKDQQ